MNVRAHTRAVVLLAVVLDVPALAGLVLRLTPEPRVDDTEVEDVPLRVLRPPDGQPRPACVFVNGAHPLRRREPVVWRLASGLARAGFVVFVPDIPGLGEGTITPRTLEDTAAVIRAACNRPDVSGGRVALIGASTGAGLALLAAGRPELAPRISVVAAVAPFADLRKLVCLTTTSSYEEEGGFARYQVTALQRQVVARSLVDALPAGRDRARLLAELERSDRAELDPLEELPRLADGLGAEARAVVALLANRDPQRYAELFEALPAAVLRLVGDLSPLRAGSGVRAPIELVVPPSDTYFPLCEALALARTLSNVRLTVTRTLDHTRPSFSLAHVRDFAAFLRFVVRGLAAAGR